MKKIPVKVAEESEITLSPGEHSELIKQIIEEFAPRYAPGQKLFMWEIQKVKQGP
ncbi:MAG: BsuBI/PstI family type II restriction endonuclease [Rhodobacteraceae bacterium]|nr:BsuBI/PstI family type II restriction endonuclease [Paracoccaceae bacterium]